MASPSNWSVVGKAKKPKDKSQHMSKAQKKTFVENMPRIDIADPMKESSTIYDAFLIREQQKVEKRQQEKFADKIEHSKEPNGKGISDGTGKKKPTINRNKNVQEKKKRPFEDVIKEVSEQELQSVLLQSRGHFPDKAEVWLKDLVSYLNFKLEYAVDTDNYLKFSNKDFPLSMLGRGCARVFTGVLRECGAATLEHLLSYSLQTMLEESQHGISTYGYKIFLQILARNSPKIVVAKLPQYKELVKSTQNRPQRCLYILWALGQVGVADLRSGLRVWLDIMLPCLSLRSLSGYCVEYLETILSIHAKQIKSAAGEIKLREFFHLLDLLFGTSLPNDIKKRLTALYPQLKMIAYGQNPSDTLRNFFPSYLTRALPDCSTTLKTELLSCLVSCLTLDKHSYALWCQHYTKHLTQSRVLLQHLVANWDGVCGGLDKKLLQQTVQSFLRTNEEGTAIRHSGECDGLNAVSEELLKKMSRPRFPWKWVMFFLVSTVIGIVAYDVYSSKTFKDSRTLGFLEAYGVLGFLMQVWNKIGLYTDIVFGWLKINVPLYCEAAYNTVAHIVWKVVDFLTHIEEYTREHRRLALDKVYAMAPDFWDEVVRYLGLGWDFMLEYSSWIYGHLVVLYAQVYHWVDDKIIHGNISTDNIQETMVWSANKVQHCIRFAIEWCRQVWTSSGLY